MNSTFIKLLKGHQKHVRLRLFDPSLTVMFLCKCISVCEKVHPYIIYNLRMFLADPIISIIINNQTYWV